MEAQIRHSLEFLNLYFYREIVGVKILLTPTLEFYLTKIR